MKLPSSSFILRGRRYAQLLKVSKATAAISSQSVTKLTAFLYKRVSNKKTTDIPDIHR